jgi:hypothetical protein
VFVRREYLKAVFLGEVSIPRAVAEQSALGSLTIPPALPEDQDLHEFVTLMKGLFSPPTPGQDQSRTTWYAAQTPYVGSEEDDLEAPVLPLEVPPLPARRLSTHEITEAKAKKRADFNRATLARLRAQQIRQLEDLIPEQGEDALMSVEEAKCIQSQQRTAPALAGRLGGGTPSSSQTSSLAAPSSSRGGSRV